MESAKSKSGPTVPESRRRDKGQAKLLLRLDADDLELLDAKRRDGESRQDAIRRMIRRKCGVVVVPPVPKTP